MNRQGSQEPGTPEKIGTGSRRERGITEASGRQGGLPGFVWGSWIKSELRRNGIPAEDSSRPLCIRRCVAQNVGLELFHLFRSPVR